MFRKEKENEKSCLKFNYLIFYNYFGVFLKISKKFGPIEGPETKLDLTFDLLSKQKRLFCNHNK